MQLVFVWLWQELIGFAAPFLGLCGPEWGCQDKGGQRHSSDLNIPVLPPLDRTDGGGANQDPDRDTEIKR